MWIFLFWAALLGILYSYLIYPQLLQSWSKGKKWVTPSAMDDLPEVSVIFAAYNEEAVMEQKLESILASDYPQNKLFITVGSDASTDRTDEIVEAFSRKNPRVQLRRFTGRTGKAQIINALAEESATEILIPTDANIIFHKDTVMNLIRWFSDSAVSIVGGTIVYASPPPKGIAPQENFYLNRENRIKTHESLLFGTAMGVEGGCYAIRRESFAEIPQNYFMEDFFQTMQVLVKGKKVVVDPEALVFEDVSVDIREEYKRKTRISIGNFQNLKHFYRVLFSQTFPLGFVFFSHKILRWITPFFLLIILLSSMQLAFYGHSLFQWIFMLGFAWMMLTLMHVKEMIRVKGILAYAAHFLYMNIALFHGFLLYTKGINSNVWQPTKRNQD